MPLFSTNVISSLIRVERLYLRQAPRVGRYLHRYMVHYRKTILRAKTLLPKLDLVDHLGCFLMAISVFFFITFHISPFNNLTKVYLPTYLGHSHTYGAQILRVIIPSAVFFLRTFSSATQATHRSLNRIALCGSSGWR